MLSELVAEGLLPAPASLTAAVVRGWQARQWAGAYVDGLLSDTRRKNGWQLAATVGDAPYGFQHLRGRAAWSADQVRDALYAYVAEHLGDPEGVVVLDETGFPKQGTHSAEVARQYCATLGKVGNCQVGVFLAYVGVCGHTLLDRRMLVRVLEAGPPVAWVMGDAVYGRSRALRGWLGDRGLPHVLAVPCNEELWAGRALWRVDEVQTAPAHREWQRLSAGAGSQGERGYDWQCWVLAEPAGANRGHYLLFRRPQVAALRAVVRAADRPGAEHARDPAPAAAPAGPGAARSAVGAGLVALVPPPVGGAGLPRPSPIPQTPISTTVILGSCSQARPGSHRTVDRYSPRAPRRDIRTQG